jgi:hypothetical protein
METSNKLIGEQLSLWTSSAGDIPVNHLAQQESEKEQMTQDTCGHGLEQPLASYNPNTQSWRMSEDISLWGEFKLLESLPKSGMTRSGVLYQQPEWVRPIDENESSLWPTPLTNDNKAGLKKANPNLIDAVLMRPNLGDPAPTTQEFKQHRMWPTPTTANWVTSTSIESTREQMANGEKYSSRIVQAVAMEEPTATGYLNPMWVEWLMGFPIGWTDLKD